MGCLAQPLHLPLQAWVPGTKRLLQLGPFSCTQPHACKMLLLLLIHIFVQEEE